jgi:hypothetical protein
MAGEPQAQPAVICGSTVGDKIESWYKILQMRGNGNHMIMFETNPNAVVIDEYRFPNGVFTLQKMPDMPKNFNLFHYERNTV